MATTIECNALRFQLDIIALVTLHVTCTSGVVQGNSLYLASSTIGCKHVYFAVDLMTCALGSTNLAIRWFVGWL